MVTGFLCYCFAKGRFVSEISKGAKLPLAPPNNKDYQKLKECNSPTMDTTQSQQKSFDKSLATEHSVGSPGHITTLKAQFSVLTVSHLSNLRTGKLLSRPRPLASALRTVPYLPNMYFTFQHSGFRGLLEWDGSLLLLVFAKPQIDTRLWSNSGFGEPNALLRGSVFSKATRLNLVCHLFSSRYFNDSQRQLRETAPLSL